VAALVVDDDDDVDVDVDDDDSALLVVSALREDLLVGPFELVARLSVT